MLFYPELPEFLFGTDDTTIKSLAVEIFKVLLIHKEPWDLEESECCTPVL
jgi:hypothetical protein